MNFLEMISWIIPSLGFMAMGFADGANGDGDKDDKGGDDKKGDDDDDDSKEEFDPTIKALQSDPDGIAKLRDQKRKANQEAKEYRLRLEKLEKEADEKEKAKLAEKGEFEKLSEQLKQENVSRAERFKETMIVKELQVEEIGLGVRNPDDVKLASREGIEFDDVSFIVSGAKEVIEKLKNDRPYLFKDEDEEGAAGSEGNTNPHESGKANIQFKGKKFDATKMDTRERFMLGLKKGK